ncbi:MULTISPECIES: ribonuclease J [unclassified Sphingopyxis]|uniref:ribonuclease J n=1 Tax=unclassified Sphingopyxis TaxID=2614943 RepID=UPI000730646E|nr:MULTISPECIES: ribonuclease J [unclassified Sphingopyxis]KTE23199.1 MBL fold metallo-hydrolase [Sphingopyxis sp. H057]KTE49437.1 MBL fold metallo-hydrolase [Sphingopyxis sp. H073]KTE50139.1 MBL fold metallo-hydrolase [Sphingopyxis sp. H071]KTE58457.1 MBL fold metallo-hydrolase [Sphingopyxis sp. H107]KTE63156.1 MBL fold metallo-hydrolase [Sphingopyxis sp. H100]
MTTPGKELLFLALGGSGEIGMNANLYGCDGKWIMLDLGVTFGSQDYPGIEIVMPDLEFIEDRKDDLLGIVLTHGHEDHIGAIPYLAADLGVPLYANRFTAGLIANKLAEEGLEKEVEIRVVDIDESFRIGPFGIRLVPLAHSILEMSAAVIDTPYGRVFHTGDWKLDDDPILGTPASAAALTAIGDEGVDVLVCDSTNAFNAQASGSEGSVRDGLMAAVGAAKGRVVVTTFASNAARLATLGAVAKATGRTLCVAGRSLDRILGVARTVGYLKDFPPTVDFDEAMRLPRNKVMVIATGGQGEPRAALARMAADIHQIKLEAGDTVVFSSKQIPGNEVAIGRIMNQLAAKDVLTVTEKQAHIHVSGHPGQPELAALYGWLRPKLLVPVHGEIRHMHEQARFALERGVPDMLVQENGDLVRLAPGPARIVERVRSGRLILDGDVILPADGETINERRKLALYGQISVAVVLSDGKFEGSAIQYRGVPVEDDRESFLEEMNEAAEQAAKGPARDREALKEAIRLGVRRVATDWTGKKPITDVLIVDV